MFRALFNIILLTLASPRMVLLKIRRGYEFLRRGDYARIRKALHFSFGQGRDRSLSPNPFDLHVASRFRTTSRIVRRIWHGNQTITANEEFRLVLYSHYDADGTVDPYVLYQLQSFAELPAKIVLVSTSGDLDEASIEAVRPFCLRIVTQKNVGWDFGCWKTALELFPDVVKRARTVILTNDSCFGPLYPLHDAVALLESHENCLGGITLSGQMIPHLQSYFLLFPSGLLRSGFLQDFRKRLRYLKSKGDAIYQYEIGTSKRATERGIELFAVVPSESALRVKDPLGPADGNRSISSWETLLSVSPFVKRSLWTQPNHRDFLEGKEELFWEHLARLQTYPPSLVTNYLRRKGLPVPPLEGPLGTAS
jgi:lipopolysaccharide biosynthesis protein